MCSSNKSAQKAAGQARNDEEARQHSLNSGMDSINHAFGASKFGEAFYNERAKAYSDYYKPQVEDQYGIAKEQLLYGLTRAGLQKSSAGVEANVRAAKELGLREQEIASKAIDYSQQTRHQVEASKAGIIEQLYATANPEAAAKAAVNSANLLATQNNNFSPLGDLFSGVSGLALTSQNARAYDPNAPGLFPSVFNKGYTGAAGGGSTGGSGRIVKG